MTNANIQVRPRTGRAVTVCIACACLFVYVWFYQGRGINQDAHFVTIRSLVERGTFEITPLRDRTLDTAVSRGRVFSNKPPGMAIVGAGPYWLMLNVERWIGLPLPDDPKIDRFNQAMLTFLLAGTPAAALAVLVYRQLRRDGAGHSAAPLALAFAFGTTLFPYSGMLYNHALVAACAFAAFHLLSAAAAGARRSIAASLLLGIAMLSEYAVAPLIAIILVYATCVHRAERNVRWRTLALCSGPVLAVFALLIYQRLALGSATSLSYGFEDASERNLHAYTPLLDWPDLRRLYWITFHRERGLLNCCPMFVLPLISLMLACRQPRRRRIGAETLCCLCIVAYYALLMMTYSFWAGGDGVGPRFVIPGLAFPWLLARPAFERAQWLAWPLIALSVFNMFAVTATRADYHGHVEGPPLHWDPIGVGTLNFLRGRLAIGDGAYNVGQVIGLPTHWSVLPAAAVILVAFGFVIWRARGAQREA